MLRYFLYLLLGLFIVLIGIGIYNVRDRKSGYDYTKTITSPELPIVAGFSKKTINPVLIDTWVDADGDARYNPDKGDTFIDKNNNGEFDAVYLAGFHQNRPAQGFHDSLWSRVMVLKNDKIKIGIAVIDAIGFGNDQIANIRAKVQESTDFDYIAVMSTHDHESPDVIGIWGAGIFKSGIQDEYVSHIVDQTALALIEADAKAEPASITFAQDTSDRLKFLVDDSRKPHVFDPGLRLMKVVSQASNKTLGTIVSWANHPETLWSKNIQITSDFPHYIRKGVEEGVSQNDSTFAEGIGGVALYINGAIGGLMHTSPRFSIPDIQTDTAYKEATFAKAEAQGNHVAMLALDLLKDSTLQTYSSASHDIISKTLYLPVANNKFKLASLFGVLDKGYSSWFTSRSEVAVWKMGPASFIFVPGEIYPEIVNGGIEHPPGGDYDIDPVEIPPLRDLMPGEYKFVFGLANDMIGYIIPKSHWDDEPPYLYLDERETYGETNSLGPETAPILHSELKGLMEQLPAK